MNSKLLADAVKSGLIYDYGDYIDTGGNQHRKKNYLEMLANFAKLQQPQWHALKDGPPDNKSIVMTYGYGCASSDYCQAYYSDGNWQEQDSCGDFFTYDPTHWAPMMVAPVYKEEAL